MKVIFNLYTMASLVNGAKYPKQEDDIERITKTLIITKKGLKFKRSNGHLQDSKTNRIALMQFKSAMDNQTLFGASAMLTKESLEPHRI